jgi:hypothetical protein
MSDDELTPLMRAVARDLEDPSLKIWRNTPDGAVEIGVDEMTDDELTAVIGLLAKLRMERMN